MLTLISLLKWSQPGTDLFDVKLLNISIILYEFLNNESFSMLPVKYFIVDS